LREILRRPELEQFAQRIAVDYHLESLSHEETRGYIRHRLMVAGGEHDLFSEDACDAVFEHCGGIPRLINLLCDYALVYAYASQAAVVTGELVEQVLREREKYGALPVFAVTQEDRVKQNLPVKETRPLKAAKLPAASVAHATRKMVAAKATTVTGSAMLMEGYGKSVNTLPPGAKHETDVETKIRAGTIDANHTKTSVTSLVEDVSIVTPVRKRVVTPLNVAGSYKALDGIETERLPLQTLPSKRQVEKPDLQPDESAQAERNRQTKAVVPPSDYSGDAQRAKPTDAGIAKSSSVLGELAARNRAPKANRYIPFTVAGGALLSIALIWFFANHQSGPTQASADKVAPPYVAAVAPAANATTVADVTPARAVPVNDRIPDTQPIERISPVSPDDTVKAVVKTDPEREARLKSIERERVSALALAKAAEREAMRNATLARERALAEDREMALAREQERENQSALAAEKAKNEARAVEAAAVVLERKPEPVLPPETRTTADTAVHKPTGVDVPSQNADTVAGNDEINNEPTMFTANPCKGPSARFLSTCE
jgi:hypothetical protein